MLFEGNIYEAFQINVSVPLRGDSSPKYSLTRPGLLNSSLVWIGVTENVLFLEIYPACRVLDHQGYIRSPVQLNLMSCDFLYAYPGKSLLGNI